MLMHESFQLAAAWFHMLTPEQQARVERDTQVLNYPAGSTIERRGEPAQVWLGVISGLVKVSVGNADGKLASLTGVPSGGWIGEGSLLKREHRRYDVVALRDSVVARMPVVTFEWLLDTSIAFNRFLLHQLNERVAQFIGKAESDRLHDPDARVARCLAELFNPLLYPGMGMRLAITQEIAQKAPLLADCNLEWVVIGHLQTNKAKDVARLAHELQSLDRIELAQALDRRLQGEGRSIDVLVQVKTSPEETKSGLEASGLISFLRELSRFDTLRVQGLMTMAENSQEEHAVRACFSTLRQLRDQARQEAIAGISLDRLSMGMSGDFEWAIEEGSTEIRVGSAIFGTRPPLIPTP